MVDRGRAGRAQPLPQDRSADDDDEQARDERQPRVELLGDDEAREEERHEAQTEDAGRMRRGHRRAEEDRVPRTAAGADQVAGDERLAVPRRERMRRAPEGRYEEREHDDAGRQRAALDERLEPAAAVRPAPLDRRRRGAPPRCRPARSARSPHARPAETGGALADRRAARRTGSPPARMRPRAAHRPARETVISRQPIRLANVRSANDTDRPPRDAR